MCIRDRALPGVYQARLTTGGKSLTASFAIKPDPRVKATAMDLEKQFDLASRVTARITQLHKAINDMRDLRAQMLVLKKRASASPGAADLLTRADDLEKKIAPIEQDLIQVKLSSSEGTLAFPTMLNEQFYNLCLLYTSDAADERSSVDLGGRRII